MLGFTTRLGTSVQLFAIQIFRSLHFPYKLKDDKISSVQYNSTVGFIAGFFATILGGLRNGTFGKADFVMYVMSDRARTVRNASSTRYSEKFRLCLAITLVKANANGSNHGAVIFEI